MPAVVTYPHIIDEAVKRFAKVFANECQRRHFAEYLTGLMIAERKSVTGIHDEFVNTTDASCLDRFLTESPWDTAELNV